MHTKELFYTCLDALAAGGFVEKQKMGRSNYYVNLAL
jgi:hypothetical protein